MIKWQHPSTAPKDTSWIAGVNSDGRLEGWTFEPKEGHWRVWSIPGFGERICLTTSGMNGWARWGDVFGHIYATTDC